MLYRAWEEPSKLGYEQGKGHNGDERMKEYIYIYIYTFFKKSVWIITCTERMNTLAEPCLLHSNFEINQWFLAPSKKFAAKARTHKEIKHQNRHGISGTFVVCF